MGGFAHFQLPGFVIPANAGIQLLLTGHPPSRV